jgi:hypothetical protein
MLTVLASSAAVSCLAANLDRTPELRGPSRVIAFNNVFLNGITTCGALQVSADTDRDNIIADAFSNAGGGGIHIFRSANVTVANNSCYNAALDPFNKATHRPGIGDLDSENNTFINNIAVGRAASGFLRTNSAFVGGKTSAGRLDHFAANISLCVNSPDYGCPPMNHGDEFSCTINQCGTRPNWLDVGTRNAGDEVTAPEGVNFALRSGSPAIGRGRLLSFLSAQAKDVGACPHEAAHCGPEKVLP